MFRKMRYFLFILLFICLCTSCNYERTDYGFLIEWDRLNNVEKEFLFKDKLEEIEYVVHNDIEIPLHELDFRVKYKAMFARISYLKFIFQMYDETYNLYDLHFEKYYGKYNGIYIFKMSDDYYNRLSKTSYRGDYQFCYIWMQENYLAYFNYN